MAQGGRIILNKAGEKVASHHINPHATGAKPTDEAVAAAHGYRTGANKIFVERSPAENAALAKAPAASTTSAPSQTPAPAPEGKGK